MLDTYGDDRANYRDQQLNIRSPSGRTRLLKAACFRRPVATPIGELRYAKKVLSRERSCFFAQLSAHCFSPCFNLCLFDRVFKHQFP